MQFQAPQGAGLYTFQAVFVGNAVADAEVWKGMQVSLSLFLFDNEGERDVRRVSLPLSFVFSR